jgi:hypothetical protein
MQKLPFSGSIRSRSTGDRRLQATIARQWRPWRAASWLVCAIDDVLRSERPQIAYAAGNWINAFG